MSISDLQREFYESIGRFEALSDARGSLMDEMRQKANKRLVGGLCHAADLLDSLIREQLDRQNEIVNAMHEAERERRSA